VVLVVALLLQSQVLFILVLQLLFFLINHKFEESKGSGQVFQVLLDKIQLIDVLVDVIMPISIKLFKPGNIGVRKMAPQAHFGIVFDAKAIFVELGPSPNLFALLIVVSNVLIIQIEGLLQDELTLLVY